MKIKTMYKAILSLAVCLTTMLVISVTVSAAEYEEIKMDVEYRIENAASYSTDEITYKFNSPYKGAVRIDINLNGEPSKVGWHDAFFNIYNTKGEEINVNNLIAYEGEIIQGVGTVVLAFMNDITKKCVGSIYFNADKGNNYINLGEFKGNTGTIKISHEHSYSGTVTSEATCTKKGSIKYTCDCGDSYTEEIPLKSHNEVTDYGKAATCTETGLTDGLHCSVCKKVLVAQSEIPKTNHEYNASYKVIKDATCTEKGTIRYYCVCGKTKDEELPLAEHEAVIDKAVAATCTKEGKTQGSHCDICNKVIIPQETVPKTDHIAVTDKAVAPTCVNSGKTEGSHCSVCKKVLKEQETIAATGKHKLKHIAEKKATESSSAMQEHWKCSVCDQLFADEKGTIPYKQLLVKDETPLMLIIGISVGALLLIGGAVTVIILILKKKSGKNTDIMGRY